MNKDLAFYERRIGAPFIAELAGRLARGEHIALLGPRRGGKSLVLAQVAALAERLPERQRPKIVHITRTGWLSNEDVIRSVAKELGVEPGVIQEDAAIGNQWNALLRSALSTTRQPVWFLVKDIIDFSAPFARGILGAFNFAFNDDILRSRHAVIVTGGADFIPLTYGRTSPYRHAERLVVTGLDEEEAFQFILRRLHLPSGIDTGAVALRVREEESSGFRYLYEQTGGNPHLIQEVIACTARHPHTLDAGAVRRWSIEAAKHFVAVFRDEFMDTDSLCVRALREAERDPSDFRLLRQVLADGDGNAVLTSMDIHPLEVWGLIRRSRDQRVAISCPLWREYLLRVSEPRRVAGSLARQHQWREAWQLYGEIPVSLRDRPMAGAARDRHAAVLRAWRESLLELSADTARIILQQFIDGAHHLLGIDQVGFYDFSSEIPKHLGGQGIDRLTLERLKRIYEPDKEKWLYLDDQRLVLASSRGTHASPRPPRSPTLVLCRSNSERVIDTADYAAIAAALEAFWHAFSAADESDYRRTLGAQRDTLNEIAQEVNKYVDQYDLATVVRRTASLLIKRGGYYRVLICLVDPRREMVQAVAHACSPDAKDISYVTDISLVKDQPRREWDIQRCVVLEHRAFRVSNAMDPRPDEEGCTTQKERAAEIGMRGIAVLPLMVEDGSVLGTIHFENTDKEKPSDDDVNLFDGLATQLAVAFHQAQRLTLLEGSLMQLRDPLWIENPQGEVIFINEAARRRDQLEQAGFVRQPYALMDKSPDVATLIARSYSGTHTINQYLQHSADRVAGDLLSAPIHDFRTQLEGSASHLKANGHIGSVHRLHDFTILYQLYSSLQRWLSDKDLRDTATKILDNFRARGYRWGRLYLYEDDGRAQSLKSFAQFGSMGTEKARAFEAGELNLTPEDEPIAWFVLTKQEAEPVVYELDRSLDIRDEPQEALPLGGRKRFRCHESNHWRARLGKNDAQWIEAPLRIGPHLVGIISLHFSEDTPPREWEFLRSALLAISFVLHHATKRDAMATFISVMNHELNTKVQAIVAGLEELAREQGTLSTETLLPLLRQSYALNQHVRELVSVGWEQLDVRPPKLTLFDATTFLQELCHSFQSQAERNALTIRVANQTHVAVSLSLEADSAILRRALETLIDNAIKYTEQGGVTLSVHETVEAVLFDVSDTGNGIEEGALQTILKPFIRGEQRTLPAGGVGLGLAICNRLIGRLNGSLSVQSNVGEGTTFTIQLPKADSDRKLPESQSRYRIAKRNPVAETFVVLVASSDERLSQILSTKLEAFGFRHEAVSTESMVLQSILSDRPAHILLLDTRLVPERRGKVMTVVSAVSPNTRIVALTGDSEESKVVRSDGAAATLVRGFKEFELAEVLAEQLGITFDYDEIVSTNDADYAREHVTAATLVGLSKETRSRLRNAAEWGDVDALADIIEDIGPLEQPLFDNLKLLLTDYDLESVLRALRTVPS